ncbi:hypothetical protein RJ640_017222 [Escallonia rubra]|uniref:Glycosyltransferase 2-like domain-containing protein n=1 Tax=Escallonia rubra TaxID=112253 RepID=A0AA88RKQ9_9ASTE|nr:hypothetical protein RJ640_017222 [Escallonia rubra]
MQGTTTWQVKTYFKEHDCPSVYYHRRATSKWLSKTYMDRIRSNPGLPMLALRDAAREEFTLGISKTQAYKAKRKALDQINGSHREQYKRIWEYCCEGLVPALHDVLPDAEHRFCNLHMYKNFKKLFKGEKMKEFMQNTSKVRITDSVKAQLSRRKTMIAEKTAKSKAAKQVSRVGAVDDTVGRFRGADTVCARRTILAQKRESLRRGCTNEDAMDEATTTEFTPTRTEPPIEAAPPDVALPEDVSFREVSSTRNPVTPRKTARTRKAATPMKSADTSKTQEKPATPRKTATTRKAMAARKPVETTPSQEKHVTPRKAVAAKKPATRKGANTSKTEGKTEMLSARTRRAQERPATTKKAQERPANPANTRKAQEKPTTPANKRKAQEKSAVSTSKYQGKPASTSKSQGKSASKDQGTITKKPVKSMQEELLQLKKEVDNTKDLLMLELKRIQDLRKRGADLMVAFKLGIGWIWFYLSLAVIGLFNIDAINEEGGWPEGPTIEDLDLAIRATLKGWKFLYLGSFKVKNELANTLKAYRYQQQQWCCGLANMFRKMAMEIISNKVGNSGVECDVLIKSCFGTLWRPVFPEFIKKELRDAAGVETSSY